MRASLWLIGLITAVFVVSGASMYLTSLNANYGLTGYSESQYESLNKMDELRGQTQNIQGNVSSTKEKENALDVVGSFVSSAFASLKLVFTSVDTFNTMADAGADGVSGLGEGVSLFKGYIVLVVAIIMFLGIALSALIKWRL